MAEPTAQPAEPLTDRWPALLAAMQEYKRQVADDFSKLAYRCVMAGVIRLDDRNRLAKAAHRAGIKPFDAQILIACAIRQWCLDQTQTKKMPSIPSAPTRSRGGWRKLALLVGAAAMVETALIWGWLGR